MTKRDVKGKIPTIRDRLSALSKAGVLSRPNRSSRRLPVLVMLRGTLDRSGTHRHGRAGVEHRGRRDDGLNRSRQPEENGFSKASVPGASPLRFVVQIEARII